MKQFRIYAGTAFLLALCAVMFFPVQAQCDPATEGDDVINCTAPVGGDIEGLGGDDVIVVDDTVNLPGNDIGGDTVGDDPGTGNDVITNNGTVQDISGDSNGGIGTGNDTIINNGTVTDGVTGDTGDGAFGSGNDTIINNGTVLGDGISGDSGFTLGTGNDTIINNGVVGGQGISGDSGFGDGTGDDVIINNGTVTTNGIAGDSALGPGSGNDQITNNGTVTGDITGDSGFGDGSGNDTLTNNGTVNGNIVGDSVLGNGTGNDTITNNGIVTGNINANGGDDTVIIQGGEVGGIIDGGADIDRLEFALQASSDEELARWAAEIVAANPGGGTITLGGVTFTWTNFEDLIEALSLRSINGNAAPMQGFCRGNGDFEIYAIVGERGVFAFRVSPQQIANALANDANTPIDTSGDLTLWALSSGELQMNAPNYEYRFQYAATCAVTLPPATPEIQINSENQPNLPRFTIINRPLE